MEIRSREKLRGILRVRWLVLLYSFDKGQCWRRIRLVCEKNREEDSWQDYRADLSARFAEYSKVLLELKLGTLLFAVRVLSTGVLHPRCSTMASLPKQIFYRRALGDSSSKNPKETRCCRNRCKKRPGIKREFLFPVFQSLSSANPLRLRSVGGGTATAEEIKRNPFSLPLPIYFSTRLFYIHCRAEPSSPSPRPSIFRGETIGVKN